eukprot:149636-Hanusia_phi.AAC.1
MERGGNGAYGLRKLRERVEQARSSSLFDTEVSGEEEKRRCDQDQGVGEGLRTPRTPHGGDSMGTRRSGREGKDSSGRVGLNTPMQHASEHWQADSRLPDDRIYQPLLLALEPNPSCSPVTWIYHGPAGCRCNWAVLRYEGDEISRQINEDREASRREGGRREDIGGREEGGGRRGERGGRQEGRKFTKGKKLAGDHKEYPRCLMSRAAADAAETSEGVVVALKL